MYIVSRLTHVYCIYALHCTSWYDKERLQEEITESSSGPCMNQHVAPSGVTHLPADLKTRLSDELRDILQAWHGAPLDLTSIYGVRYSTAGVCSI